MIGMWRTPVGSNPYLWQFYHQTVLWLELPAKASQTTQLPRQMSAHCGRTLKSGFQVQFCCHLQYMSEKPEANAIRVIHKHCPVHASETTRGGGDGVYSNSESSYPDQWLANERAYLSENGLKRMKGG